MKAVLLLHAIATRAALALAPYALHPLGSTPSVEGPGGRYEVRELWTIDY